MAKKAFALNVRSQAKFHTRQRICEQSIHDAIGDVPSSHLRSDTVSQNTLYLQRVIGNQAVQRLFIARQEAPVVDAPAPTTVDVLLTPAQVQSAIAFYVAQPARYTRDIIMEIQMAVGTTPTGKMGPVDVQAVAKRQQELNGADEEPQLKIDGKAGPRTLPSIFKFGLTEDDSISDYTQKAREMWDNRNGQSEEDTARKIVNDLINKRLTDLNIPPIDIDISSTGSRGTFNSADWKLNLDTLQFQPGKFHDLRETTATIYHEARHAEQDFRIGQLLARKGKDATQINAITGLNLKVAEKAVDTKSDITPMQALIAQGWFDSKFSEVGRERFQRNNAELRTTFAAREAACDAFKQNPTPENKTKLEKAKARFSKAIEEHDDMPHEFDAERVEAKVKKLFGKGEDHNDPCE